MKLTMTYSCAECGHRQSQKLDFEPSESGLIIFFCAKCNFENAISWAEAK